MNLAPLWSRTARSIWLGLACAALVHALGLLSLFAGLEDWMLDAAFNWRGTRASKTRDRVVLVTLTQESLRRLGKPTSYLSPELGLLVRHLRRQGVAAVGIDVLIPEELDGLRDISSDGGPGESRSMGEALRQAGNVVVPCWWLAEGPQLPLTRWQILHFDSPPEEGPSRRSSASSTCRKTATASSAGSGSSGGPKTSPGLNSPWRRTRSLRTNRSASTRAATPSWEAARSRPTRTG